MSISEYKRDPALDGYRGIAVLMMFVYHSVFFSNVFMISKFNLKENIGWILLQKSTAVIFLILAGISLSYFKNSKNRDFFLFLRKFPTLIFCAMVVSLVSMILLPSDTMIIFGVLHVIALSRALSWFLVGKLWTPLFWAAIIFIISLSVKTVHANEYFVWTGLSTVTEFRMDQQPLFPSWGYFLSGVFIGNLLLYKKWKLPWPQKRFYIIEFLGKHSLFIYMVHVPIVGSIIIPTAILGGYYSTFSSTTVMIMLRSIIE